MYLFVLVSYSEVWLRPLQYLSVNEFAVSRCVAECNPLAKTLHWLLASF